MKLITVTDIEIKHEIQGKNMFSGLRAKSRQQCVPWLSSPLLYLLRLPWRPGTLTPSWTSALLVKANSGPVTLTPSGIGNHHCQLRANSMRTLFHKPLPKNYWTQASAVSIFRLWAIVSMVSMVSAPLPGLVKEANGIWGVSLEQGGDSLQLRGDGTQPS